jgi:hypothetical protein
MRHGVDEIGIRWTDQALAAEAHMLRRLVDGEQHRLQEAMLVEDGDASGELSSIPHDRELGSRALPARW